MTVVNWVISLETVMSLTEFKVIFSVAVFIMGTFGVLFAGIYIAALTAFLERFDSFWVFLNTFLPF